MTLTSYIHGRMNGMLGLECHTKTLFYSYRPTSNSEAMQFRRDPAVGLILCTVDPVTNGRCESGTEAYAVSRVPPTRSELSTLEDWQAWHARLGHRALPSVAAALGIPLPAKIRQAFVCTTCIAAKFARVPRTVPAEHFSAPRPGWMIHMDLLELRVPGPMGARYVMLFVDEFSKRVFTYMIHRKSTDVLLETYMAFHKHICALLGTSTPVAQIVCDGESGWNTGKNIYRRS